MIDKIVIDEDDGTKAPKHHEEYVEELLVKINEIIEWINTQ